MQELVHFSGASARCLRLQASLLKPQTDLLERTTAFSHTHSMLIISDRNTYKSNLLGWPKHILFTSMRQHFELSHIAIADAPALTVTTYGRTLHFSCWYFHRFICYQGGLPDEKHDALNNAAGWACHSGNDFILVNG